MTDPRTGCPERAVEPSERTDQDVINRLAFMALELTEIKSFCEDAYSECFDRYRRLANAEA